MIQEQIKILQRLNRDALLQAAFACAGGWTCEFFGDPILSSTAVTLLIKFTDRLPMWAARIPLDQDYPFYDLYVQPLVYLECYHPTIPAPRVHGYVDTNVDDNPVGVGYMFCDWIEGRPLPPWSLAGLPVLKRQRVLDQLAEHLLELFIGGVDPNPRDIRFYGVPEGTPDDMPISATEWLIESIDRGIRRSLRRGNVSDAIDYLIQRALVPAYVVPEFDDTPWVVMHGNLRYDSILVDEDYNIRGIIGWHLTFAYPLQKAATFPFLFENIPGSTPPAGGEELKLIDRTPEKNYFLSIFAAKEMARTGQTRISELIQTCYERAFFELSHHYHSIRAEFVKQPGFRTAENVAAAMEQLGQFLLVNQEFFGEEAALLQIIRGLYDLEEDLLCSQFDICLHQRPCMRGKKGPERGDLVYVH
ncbi:hypothetical protein VTO42DRAFT_8260 [Malbranchea cinnamomea]